MDTEQVLTMSSVAKDDEDLRNLRSVIMQIRHRTSCGISVGGVSNA